MKLAALVLLASTLALTGLEAKEDALTLRIRSDDGQIQFFHHGKRLKDSTLERLCAEARSRKVEIEFQREKMTANDALAAILKEAQCLGACPAGSSASGRDREPKPSAQRHARHRHKAAARR